MPSRALLVAWRVTVRAPGPQADPLPTPFTSGTRSRLSVTGSVPGSRRAADRSPPEGACLSLPRIVNNTGRVVRDTMPGLPFIQDHDRIERVVRCSRGTSAQPTGEAHCGWCGARWVQRLSRQYGISHRPLGLARLST